jgi:hypothetical protein
VSLKEASATYSKQEEVVSKNMINKIIVGPTITSYSLNNSLASEVKLFLHFASKWIILSEVYFKTEQVNIPILENKENVNKTVEIENVDKKEMKSAIQDMPLDDSKIILENSSKDLKRKAVVPSQSSDYKQTYIGIAIGILGMAVIMLMFTIFSILRKNRQRIFIKHSNKSFKTFVFSSILITFSFSSCQ